MKNLILFGVLLFASSVEAEAQNAKFGDWHVDLSAPDKKFAYTANKAGEILGQLCTYSPDGNDCVYVFSMDLECKEGNEYPVLVNSDAGATNQKIGCGGMLSGRSYRYFFYFDEINETIETASRISIVFPTKDDQFRVLRFSLVGSGKAISVMNESANAMFKEYRPAKETLL